MALYGLRDQFMLDNLSNFSIWKARILIVLEAYGLREYVEKVLDIIRQGSFSELN